MPAEAGRAQGRWREMKEQMRWQLSGALLAIMDADCAAPLPEEAHRPEEKLLLLLEELARGTAHVDCVKGPRVLERIVSALPEHRQREVLDDMFDFLEKGLAETAPGRPPPRPCPVQAIASPVRARAPCGVAMVPRMRLRASPRTSFEAGATPLTEEQLMQELRLKLARIEKRQ